MPRKNQEHRRDQRREDAEKRQAAHDSLSLSEKIDKVLSRGGGQRELQRLRAQETA